MNANIEYPAGLYGGTIATGSSVDLDRIGDGDIDFFHREGYLVVERAFDSGQIEAARQAVDDLIDGFVHAGNQSATGELRGRASYTLPSNQAVTLRELAELWMSANNRRVEINWGIRPHRDGEVMAPWDGEPLPGWSPQVDLKAGLKDC